MQTLSELNENFGIPGVLAFEEVAGLTIARVTGESCSATLFLQGAHLVHWAPEGAEPVLFLSQRSAFEHGKPIRGGIPLVFPWFAARTGERTDGPSHGFARTSLWEVSFAATFAGDVHMTLSLRPDENSRSLGFDNFDVSYEILLGRTLDLRLNVGNRGEAPLHFEEAMHTYFEVGDAESIRLHGLGGAEFLDKTDNFQRKTQHEEWLTLQAETDRVYPNTVAAVKIEDPVLRRHILVEKQSSKTTVVWNPWADLAARLPDMADDGWKRMVCVETANAGEDAVTLQPGEVHTMEAHIYVASAGGATLAESETE